MKKTGSFLVVAGLTAAWGSLAAQLPAKNPEATGTDVAMTMPDAVITGSIPRSSSTAPVSGDLKAGLYALSDKKPQPALAVRNGMTAGSLDRHILSWAIVTSGLPG